MLKEAFYIITDTFDFRIHLVLTALVTVIALASAYDTYTQQRDRVQCGYVSYHTIER